MTNVHIFHFFKIVCMCVCACMCLYVQIHESIVVDFRRQKNLFSPSPLGEPGIKLFYPVRYLVSLHILLKI